jgi:pimeloyl-ACP methyl ester carboxylesterase
MGLRATAAIALAVVLAVAAAGCAGRSAVPAKGTASSPATVSEPTASTPTPSAISQVCGPPDAPGRLTTIRAADGVRLSAAEVGAGERGVVLIPELGARGKCGWWDFAAYLAAKGFRVLLFDHRCTGESACASGDAGAGLMSDIRGAVSWLRQEGVAKVALVGASQGGSEALIVAALPQRGVAGVVALSADELTMPLAGHPYPLTALSAASRLRLPALFAVATRDPFVSVRDTRHLFAVTGSRSKHLIVLSAAAGHGWDLVSSAVSGGTRPAFSRAVLAFLQRVTS